MATLTHFVKTFTSSTLWYGTGKIAFSISQWECFDWSKILTLSVISISVLGFSPSYSCTTLKTFVISPEWWRLICFLCSWSISFTLSSQKTTQIQSLCIFLSWKNSDSRMICICEKHGNSKSTNIKPSGEYWWLHFRAALLFTEEVFSWKTCNFVKMMHG